MIFKSLKTSCFGMDGWNRCKFLLPGAPPAPSSWGVVAFVSWSSSSLRTISSVSYICCTYKKLRSRPCEIASIASHHIASNIVFSLFLPPIILPYLVSRTSHLNAEESTNPRLGWLKPRLPDWSVYLLYIFTWLECFLILYTCNYP